MKLDSSMKLCETVIAYQAEHGRLPSITSSDKLEQKLGRWTANMKQAKKQKNSMTWYDELEQLAVKAGYDKMFEIKNMQQLQLERTKELIEWMMSNKKVPSSKSKDGIEKQKANFLTNLKRGHRNIGRSKLYLSTVEYIKNSIYPNLLDSRSADHEKN